MSISRKRLASDLLVLVLPLTMACPKDTTSPASPSPGAMVENAWSLFEQRDYPAARSGFLEALAAGADSSQAEPGLAWSTLMTDSLSQAMERFRHLLHLPSTDQADAWAGLTIAARDLAPPRFDLTETSARAALELRPRYVFFHDTRIDWRDLRLLLAESLFGLGRYPESAAQVDSLGGHPIDLQSPDGLRDLLREIERLNGEIRERGD